MSGKQERVKPLSFERDGEVLTDEQLSNVLNRFYVSISADIPPLDVDSLPAFLPSNDVVPTIEPYQVCKKLLKINPNKAMGPDNIPSRILKEFAVFCLCSCGASSNNF